MLQTLLALLEFENSYARPNTFVFKINTFQTKKLADSNYGWKIQPVVTKKLEFEPRGLSIKEHFGLPGLSRFHRRE